MRKPKLTDSAQADLEDILAWSEIRFGELSRQRYEALITAALLDIALDPARPGSTTHPKYGFAVRSWHLRLSRAHVPIGVRVVQNPRHKLFYRVVQEDTVWVGRILHEKMDPARHLSSKVWRSAYQ